VNAMNSTDGQVPSPTETDDIPYDVLPASPDASCVALYSDLLLIYVEPREKRPRVGVRFTDSLPDATEVLAWVGKGGNAGVRLDGRVVLDFDPRGARCSTCEAAKADCAHGDPREKHERALDEVTRRLGGFDPRESLTTWTAGDGAHHYLHATEEQVATLRSLLRGIPGLDIKAGSGAQVVCAGSLHPNGRRYKTDMRSVFGKVLETAAGNLAFDEPRRPSSLILALPLLPAVEASAGKRLPPGVSADVRDRDWEIYREGLSERVQMVLEQSDRALERFEGKADRLDDKSQSGIEASFAALLRQANVDLGEIEAALVEMRARSGAKDKDEDYFIRTVNLVRDLGYSIAEVFTPVLPEDLKNIPARESAATSESTVEKKESVLQKLKQATTHFDWCADQFDDVIVSVPRAEGWRHLPADSKAAREEVEAAYARAYATVPKRDAIDAFIATKKVEARDKSRRCVSARRIASIGDRIYLDLAQGEIVEMSATGWHVRDDSPALVRFLRTAGTLPLPRPERGGSFDLLRKFANVDDDNFVLLVASLLGLALAKGPYIVLLLIGEHGSTKTTLARLLVSIVDPRDPSGLVPSGKPEDVLIAARERHVTFYDNVSRVPDWFSDILCCLATGAGYAKRKLYTDGEGSQLSVMRPQVLTSIEEAINRSDLLSRAITVQLKRQPAYRTEEAVRADFDEVHPRLVGALCTAISTALGSRAEVDDLPRMADFAKFVARAEPALPWKPGTFLRLYRRQLGESARVQVEGSPVASALVEFMVKRGSSVWEGHAKDLLDELGPWSATAGAAKAWPRSPKGLRSVLRRHLSDLREFGVEVDLKVGEDARGVLLRVKHAGTSARADATASDITDP
jgi:hypothetical protein